MVKLECKCLEECAPKSTATFLFCLEKHLFWSRENRLRKLNNSCIFISCDKCTRWIVSVKRDDCCFFSHSVLISSLKNSVMGLKFILIQNRQGKTRLAKWYSPYSVSLNC